MKIEIDLADTSRKVALNVIDEAVKKGATTDDLMQIVHSLFVQKNRFEQRISHILDECRDYKLTVYERKLCYDKMNNADALITHCKKLIAQLSAREAKNKKHIINLAELNLAEDPLTDIISYIGSAVVVSSAKTAISELKQIISDLQIQKSKMSSIDKTFYDRVAIANKIIEFCKQQIKGLQSQDETVFIANPVAKAKR